MAIQLNQYNDVDMTNAILAEKALAAIVKEAFHNHRHYYYKIHKKDYHGLDKKHVKISNDSWIDALAIEECLNLMVSQREQLKNTVVLPVFSNIALTFLAEQKISQSPATCFTVSTNVLQMYSQGKLLEIFLECVLETYVFYQVPKNGTKQIIIPLLIDEHYTIAVVKLAKSTYSNIAQIQYYNSYGENLENSYIEAIKNFFNKRSFIPKFINLSEPEQRDSYNCGLFIMHKAIEMATNNTGIKEALLPSQGVDWRCYQSWALRTRAFIAETLNIKNFNVLASI